MPRKQVIKIDLEFVIKELNKGRLPAHIAAELELSRQYLAKRLERLKLSGKISQFKANDIWKINY